MNRSERRWRYEAAAIGEEVRTTGSVCRFPGARGGDGSGTPGVQYVCEYVQCTLTDGNYPRLQKVIYPNGREVYYKYTDTIGPAGLLGTRVWGLR